MGNEITSRESVQIDKQLSKINDIVDTYSNYYFCKDQLEQIRKMRDEIANIFDSILLPYDGSGE